VERNFVERTLWNGTLWNETMVERDYGPLTAAKKLAPFGVPTPVAVS
jgi:hypothetical protein